MANASRDRTVEFAEILKSFKSSPKFVSCIVGKLIKTETLNLHVMTS